MILLSSGKLERAIAKKILSNWEKTKYIILPIILTTLFYGPFYIIRPNYGVKPPLINSLFTFFFCIISTFIVYSGIKKCFKTNESTDKEFFIERFMILLIPIMFKLILFFVPFILILVVIVGSMREHLPIVFKRFPIILSAFCPIMYYIQYYLLNRSFVRLGNLLEKYNKESGSNNCLHADVE